MHSRAMHSLLYVSRHQGINCHLVHNLANTSGHSLAFSDIQIIELDCQRYMIDFITLHNIIYYMYCGLVNLPIPNSIETYNSKGFPEIADPFALYRNSL